ncbi:MAG: putative metal-binding motif-containing protein [Patescibacteria group bacterium]
MAEGSDLIFNGRSGGVNQEGGEWWCNNSTSIKTVLMAAWWNGKLLAGKIVPVQNPQKTGYNCKLTATTVQSCPTNDKDCDGSTVPNDCDDANPLAYPGQVETTGDNVDYNCDNFPDMSDWQYAVSGIGSGYIVQLVDGKSWANGDFQTTYAMGLVSGSYVAKVSPTKAPTEYIVRYRWTSSDPWLWSTSQNGNSCIIHIPHLVTELGKNTVIPFTANPNYYCHFVKQ